MAVFLVLTLALVAGVVIGAQRLLGSFGTEDYGGEGRGEVLVKVEASQTATQIAGTLETMDVVKSADAFVEAAKDDSRSRGIQPGSYRLRAQMSGQAALALMLDPGSRAVGTVVVTEGLSARQVLQRVADGTEIPLAELEAAAADPRSLGTPSWAGDELEGLLFPATYEFEPDQDATAVLSEMVARFGEESRVLDLEARAEALGRTPYEIVTIASLAEREARKPDEFAKVSRVIYNRLAVDMRLEIDATVLFGLGRTSGALTKADLLKATPYNTRLNVPGLPPTPIASPGTAALEAALAPVAGDWVFYVLAAPDGTQFFTSNYDEFRRVRDESRAAGLF